LANCDHVTVIISMASMHATPHSLRPYAVFITNRFYLGKSNRITVTTIFCLSQCVHIYYICGCWRENKSLFAWRTNPDLSTSGRG